MTKTAKSKAVEIIGELRRHRDTCGLHDMTFARIPERFKEQMEADRLYQFRLWWNSWIGPKLDELERTLAD